MENLSVVAFVQFVMEASAGNAFTVGEHGQFIRADAVQKCTERVAPPD